MSSIDLQLHKARSLARTGHLDQAQSAVQAILASHPANRRAQKALAEVAALAADALDPGPQDKQQLAALCAGGRHAEALSQARDLTRRHPRSAYLWNLMGTLCLACHDNAAAELCFRQADVLNPQRIEPLMGLACCMEARDDIPGAIACLQLATERKPEAPDPHHRTGVLYIRIDCLELALEPLRRAMKLAPDQPAIRHDLAVALIGLGRTDQAKDLLARSLRRWPKAVDLLLLSARTAEAEGDHPAVIAWAERVLAIQDSDPARLSILVAQREMADWTGWADLPMELARLGGGHPVVSPGPIVALIDDPVMLRRHAERQIAPIAGVTPPAINRDRNRRLRLAYVSSDFENHATMVLMAGLFEAHDCDRFEVFAYSHGKDCDDAARRRLLASVEHFRDVRRMTDAGIAALARQDGIDIAIDLKGYTRDGRSRAFAHRLAPVQMAWLGWPGTMGSGVFDYAIVDRVTVPDDLRSGFGESLMRMPHSYQVNDDKRPRPSPAQAREAYGLPDTGFVFCCFNAARKISPREFDIWMRLLTQVKGSVLWLLSPDDQARANLQAAARARGVDDKRLVFADKIPLDQHLARHGAADLFLDSFCYNAHTTCSDALWAGLPVLTLPGRQFAARVGASLLTAAGLPELIARDEADYERIALHLARNPRDLDRLRARVLAARDTAPLFDTKGFARDLEEGYALAFERCASGLPPQDFDVPLR